MRNDKMLEGLIKQDKDVKKLLEKRLLEQGNIVLEEHVNLDSKSENNRYFQAIATIRKTKRFENSG